MRQPRLEQLSIYYWLEDLFSSVSFVNITKAFPTEELELPTISLVPRRIETFGYQLGSGDLHRRNWAIYIFAENEGQLADYADLIMEALEDNLCVYDYNQGFPPDVTPDQIGSLVVSNLNYTPLETFEELVAKKYWWGVITFQTRPSTD